MSGESKLAPPRMIGRYEVIAEIAQGGMGVVYLARHAGEAGFQRLFAIKLMHPHLAEDRLFVDMLRDEARIAAHIHHPNVVPIFDLGSDGGRHYVVMEYVDGCSLAALLARNKPNRKPELVVPIVIDMLEGLHAAHTLRDLEGSELKLVHRDVSPQNVLIGVDGVARLTDFGIAKAETRITSTRPGIRKGKLSYMSPEQLKDDGDHIDHRADIFAAGAVLWGALTAQPLFRGTSDAATLHNILNKAIAPPSSVGLHPPDAFDAICLKALERSPSRRYASALDMADALREALESLGIRLSRARVADWIKTSFAAELTLRHNAIRTAAHRSRPPAPDESLPALPPLAGPASLPSLSTTSPSDVMAVAATASTAPPSLTTVSSSRTLHPIGEDATQADFRPKRKLLLIVGAALASLAVLVVWLATRPSDEEPTGAASTAAAAPDKPATTAEAPPQPATPETDEAPPAASAQTEVARTPRATSAKSWSPRPRRTSEPAAKPEPKATAATTATTPATASPKPTSTSAATGVKIEKNPYLRRD